ncbi:MAG: metal-dependent hydrolase [Planctomycetes bacterium]|nr:metal-dependent hydrolase [Planctomycetota bacterium]
MSPITHGLFAWVLANGLRDSTRRERVIVTVGGLVPDVDGVGAVPDMLTRWFTDAPTSYFHQYHHDLHNVLFACVASAGAATLATGGLARRLAVAALFCAAFHLHLVCDLVGSAGPDGSIWDVPYLRPFTEAGTLAWSGQWRLDGWQNITITLALLAVTAWFGLRRGRTAVEVVSTRADAAVVEVLRRRFGTPATQPLSSNE